MRARRSPAFSLLKVPQLLDPRALESAPYQHLAVPFHTSCCISALVLSLQSEPTQERARHFGPSAGALQVKSESKAGVPQKKISMAEVEQHTTKDSAWFVRDGKVHARSYHTHTAGRDHVVALLMCCISTN